MTMMTKKITYKLLINPYNPLKVFLREITINTDENENVKLDKRDIHDYEIKEKWTKKEFMKKLTESGYEKSAINFIAAHPYGFKNEDE